MTERPPGSKDRLARAFVIVVLLMLAIGVGLAIRAQWSSRDAVPQSATTATAAAPTGLSLGQLIGAGVAKISGLINGLRSAEPERAAAPPAPAKPAQRPGRPAGAAQPTPAAQAADPQRRFPETAPPKGPQVMAVPVDGRWAYDVSFGPAWQKGGQLRYNTYRKDETSAKGGTQSKVGSNMSWTPNGGQPTSWYFGIVEADHPTHANTRFPGFFMHAAYLPQSLQAGNRILWEFPWQGGGSGQVRRFDMRVAGWERVTVPAGEFTAVHLEGKLQYVDKDAVRAEVRYALWYAPRAKQAVRLLWMGKAPDEGSAEMMAELASFSVP